MAIPEAAAATHNEGDVASSGISRALGFRHRKAEVWPSARLVGHTVSNRRSSVKNERNANRPRSNYQIARPRVSMPRCIRCSAMAGCRSEMVRVHSCLLSPDPSGSGPELVAADPLAETRRFAAHSPPLPLLPASQESAKPSRRSTNFMDFICLFD